MKVTVVGWGEKTEVIEQVYGVIVDILGVVIHRDPKPGETSDESRTELLYDQFVSISIIPEYKKGEV